MNGQNSPLRILKFIYHLPSFVKLFWRLLKDPRIPAYKKILPVIAGILCLLYIVFPFDALPDPYPVIGYLDDVTVILFLMVPSVWLFIRSCPKDIVKEHAQQVSQRG
jgi:uncharacterized membrane protein YkvA (DUF1232 family)